MNSMESKHDSEFQSREASVQVGLITLEKYADITGLPVQVCLGHVNKGLIPCVTIGRRRLINVIALQRELAKKPFVL